MHKVYERSNGMRKSWFLFVVLALSACTFSTSPGPSNQIADLKQEQQAVVQVKPAQTKAPTNSPIPSLTQVPSSTPPAPIPTATYEQPLPAATETAQIFGPDAFPQGMNPLTGLPIEDAALLTLPPALVSVANFPVTARPQAGLSFSPFVFEMYIGEGMTRFLALFYGDYPRNTVTEMNQSNMAPLDNTLIGPIRSGRLPYESIRKLYNGFLVMASAYRAVSQQLGSTTNVYGSDEDDINSALIDVSKLQDIAEASANNPGSMNLTGNQFSLQAPKGGQEARRLWVFYNFLNQVDWQYDPVVGAYLRYQDEADGSGTFIPSTDRLTGEQLAFENVILLSAKHKVLNSERTLIDVELLYSGNEAYLFRDGKVYPIYWNTMNGEYEKSTGLMRPIRFTDREGNPISMKPGQTWVEILDTTATLEEIEAGAWKARFYAP